MRWKVKKMSDKKLNDEQLEELALKNLQNFGDPQEMWVPGYGQVLRDGKYTEEGLRWLKDAQEATEKEKLLYKAGGKL